MKKIIFIIAFLSLTSVSWAQGVNIHDIALSNISGFAKPVSGAIINVCTATAVGIPCSPAATVYTDSTLTTISSSTFNADNNGNFNFWVAPGNYIYTITGIGLTGQSVSITASCASSLTCVPIGTQFPIYNVKNPPFNASGSARKVTDGVTNSSTLVTSATAAFTQADVGKNIWGFTAGSNGGGTLRIPTGSKITAVISSTNINITPAAGTNSSGVTLIIGNDDTAALIAAANAAKPTGTVYIPCGNYVVTSPVFRIDTSWTNLTIAGDSFGCSNIWFSHDFAYDGSGKGQIADFASALATVRDMTVDGLSNAPSAIANQHLFAFGSEGIISNVQVRNWGVSTGANNICFGTSSDILLVLHPKVNCTSTGGWQVQSLGVDIFDPDITGGEYAINFSEQGGRMYGGRASVAGNATHVIMTSSVGGVNVNDIFIFGTHVSCSSVTCFGFDLTVSGNTLHLIGVDCSIYQNQTNIPNAGCVKTAAGTTAFISNSILYARSTNTIFSNSGRIVDGGGNTISADSNGTVFGGTVAIESLNPLGVSHFATQAAAIDIAGTTACSSSTKTITFVTAYINTPIIVVSDETASGGARVSAKSNTAFTVTCSGATDTFDYHIIGNPN